MKRWSSILILILKLMVLLFLIGCPDNDKDNSKDNFTAQVTINNLDISCDSKINVFLYEYPVISIFNGYKFEIWGSGFVKNGSVSILLNNSDDETPWLPSGSYYVLFGNETDDNIYISINQVNFNNNPQPVLSFSSFKRMAFSWLLVELFDDAAEIIGSSTITLDELVYILSEGYYNYSKMMEEYDFQFYKDPDFTQPFSGDDIVDIKTVFYTYNFLFGGGDDGGN